MFEYEKQKLQNKIEELRKELEIKKMEQQNYKNKVNHINYYLAIKNSISTNKSFMIGFLEIGSLINIVGIIYNSWIVTLWGFTCYGVSTFLGHSISESKQKLKNEYADLYDYSDVEIDEESYLLREKEYDAYSKQLDIYNCMNRYKSKIEKLNHYENTANFLNSPEGLLLNASSEEEYNFLKQNQEEKLNLFADYLDEKIDCSSVHFNNGIGESIQYAEESKKLMKKM